MTETTSVEAMQQDPGDPPQLPAANGRSSRRRRYGRRRGRLPLGDTFIPRLGPHTDEPFAGIDDPDDGVALTRPGPDEPITSLRFVALDCETTGQLRHQVVELGAVAFTLDAHIMSFETLVHTNDRINPYARRIHGISSETLGGAPPLTGVVERFSRFARGAVLVEHSADAFDTRLLARAMGAPLDADNIDTSRLASKLWGLRDTIGLERLCDQLGVRHRRPHHALADAEATAACFTALVRLGQDRFWWRTLGDLLADGRPPQRLDANGSAVAIGGTGPRRRSRSRSRGGRSR
ncbi:MAG: 3'-5' exonuclease [Candidatus Dormibacteria bacterium]